MDSNKTIPDTIETVMSDSALEGVGRGFHFVSPSQYQILIKSLGHVGMKACEGFKERKKRLALSCRIITQVIAV